MSYEEVQQSILVGLVTLLKASDEGTETASGETTAVFFLLYFLIMVISS